MRKVNEIQKVVIMFFIIALAFAGVVQASETAKVDLNKATVQELVKLKGIGKKYAERIIEYRDTNGKFEKVEDVMKVKGIGQKKFEAIKEFIFVEKGK